MLPVPSSLRLLLPALLLLGACTTNEPANHNPQAPVADLNTNTAPPTAAQLLEQSRGLAANEATALLLQAATLQRDSGDHNGALATLNRIPATGQPPATRVQVQLLRAGIAMTRNLPRETLALLQENNLPPAAVLTNDQQLQIRTLRATALSATGASLNSALELIALDPLLAATARRTNHGGIWQKLALLPQQQLKELSTTTDDVVLRGWYELALASSTTSSDMDRQLMALQQWSTAWSTHPAALQMPPQMELMETLARERPQRIALLLPLGTNAGTIVRDAFMGAYYHLQDLGGQVPMVKLYDTTDSTDILQLHLRARQEGAQLIIGPLLKPQVAQLQASADLGVPTLALNSIEGTVASPLLYQFALSPEDEVRQLAEKAWADGHRRVAILSPSDENSSDLAIRKRDSFRAVWEKIGGTVVALDSYREDYTDSISRMMLLHESGERHKRLNQLLGRTTVSQLRRRQDVDCIYLVAQPAAARQIIPSLAYFYSGDIPVYAAQDLYSATARQTDDRDLNGVIFGESPWLLGEAGDISRLRQLFPMSSAQNLRLQAFGIDAFRLYPRLRLLETGTDAAIPGVSGSLKLGPNHTITRKLDWATITDGLITPLH